MDEVTWLTFQPKLEKLKYKIKNIFLYIFSQKNVFLIFWVMELSGPKIKYFFIFFQEMFFLYFGKWNILALRLKKLLFFWKKNFAYITI